MRREIENIKRTHRNSRSKNIHCVERKIHWVGLIAEQ